MERTVATLRMSSRQNVDASIFKKKMTYMKATKVKFSDQKEKDASSESDLWSHISDLENLEEKSAGSSDSQGLT